MMKVWAVMVLEDDEYGCMDIERIFANKEDAEAYMAKQIAEAHEEELCDENGKVELWYGVVNYYAIKEYKVH